MEIKKSILTGIENLIRHVGDDPNREGLQETPRRVMKAFQETCWGYKYDPRDFLRTSFSYNPRTEERSPVIVDNISVHSTCEHHLSPFIGYACVAYIPNDRIIGLSKIIRAVNILAKRLQTQENLTDEICYVINDSLKCHGVGVSICAEHFCMKTRGVEDHSSVTKTHSFAGNFLHSKEYRDLCYNSLAMKKIT